ncbi:MAG: glycosyltransferase [Deltaproteobacteria bacterium HGW-Deltaproteobacteria-15]|nr:MAG: glycosyltransferase [Deltaproteobacteria bacterium HGW-Deltaproteobacteria-15]
MRIAMFYHSLVSDWNNGNAHFLRGVVTELLNLGHKPLVYEPADGWSLENLKRNYGSTPLSEFRRYYHRLRSFPYKSEELDLDSILEDVDLVIVHEWNEPALIRRLGRHRLRSRRYKLLFHDTHHRAYSHPQEIGAFELENYDGVLAYGETIQRIYLEHGWNRRVWTWHEAADSNVFVPYNDVEKNGDVVWIGNWGDEERTREYIEFFLEPVRSLGLHAMAYGVRYPREGLRMLKQAGIEYGGWVANYKVPEVYSRYRLTLHIPRRPYVEALPGIPTIRPFEALACGIPLISSPWEDSEGLFSPGEDFLIARNGREMKEYVRLLLRRPEIGRRLSENGRRKILQRHTCAHRVQELLAIYEELGVPACSSGKQEKNGYRQLLKPVSNIRRKRNS